MPQNLVTATLAAADRDAVLALAQQIRAKLPFLRGLAPDERRGLARMGGKSVAFVRQALRTAEQHPALVPAPTVPALREDLALLDALPPVRAALRPPGRQPERRPPWVNERAAGIVPARLLKAWPSGAVGRIGNPSSIRAAAQFGAPSMARHESRPGPARPGDARRSIQRAN